MNKNITISATDLSVLMEKAHRAIKLGRTLSQMANEELWEFAEVADQILYLLPCTKYTARVASELISLQAAALRKLPAEIW